jgi:tetratricopeptide (TPR) repeat protein
MWDLDVAEKAFRDSINADQPFPYGEVRLAGVLADRLEYREAQAILTDLLARQPDYHLARLELGRILGELGHTEEAVSVLTEATKSREQDADARLAIADVLLMAGRADEAIRAAQEAVQSRPDAETYSMLSAAFLAAGDPSKAETAAMAAVQKDARSSSAHLALAKSLAANGKTDAARDEAATALDLHPYSVEALRFAGSLRRQAGDYRACADLWQRALKLDPWSADLHRLMADLLDRDFNDNAAALEHYRRCFELEDLRAAAAR